MRVVFIGPPGAGKGTQCARLASHLAIPHLSTGDILRQAVQDETELGRRVGPIMEQGGLVSDDLMMGVVRERLARPDCANGYLLDGFPRTVPQAESLVEYLAAVGQQLDHVVELRVPDDELRRRLEQRFRQMEQPRPDDHPDAIPNRLEVYHSETAPLLDYYSRAAGVLKTVDGTGSMDDVFQRIIDALQA
jgi:adenylate kinase